MNPDHQIIRDILSGNTEAFSELVQKYQDKVLRLCFAMVGPSDAEDAAQEAFLKVYGSLSKFRGESSFSTWLYRVASNHCLDLLYKRKRQKEESLDSLNEKSGEGVFSDSPASSPGRSADSLMRRETVLWILERLSPEERRILVLREIEGLSYIELSQTMGISMDLVKVRLFRARKAFSKEAKNHGLI